MEQRESLRVRRPWRTLAMQGLIHPITPHSRKGRGKNGQGEGAAPHPFTRCHHRQGVIPVGLVQGRRECKTLDDR